MARLSGSFAGRIKALPPAATLPLRKPTANGWHFLTVTIFWNPTKQQRQMDELRRDPLADLCYSARIPFQEEDGARRWGSIYPVPPPDRIRKALFNNTTFLPSSVLMRRSTFLAAGGFDPEIKFCEDWDLWLRMLHAGVQFAGCDEPLLLYPSARKQSIQQGV